MITKRQLEKFCDYDGDQPYVNGNSTYASDGRIAVRAFGSVSGVTRTEAGRVPTIAIHKAIDGAFAIPGDWGPVPFAATPTCQLCHGRGTGGSCPECRGDGSVYFDNEYNDYECDCETCDAGGIKGPWPCKKCGGSGAYYGGPLDAQARVRIGLVDVWSKYIAKICQLPRVEIKRASRGAHKDGVAFSFLGGRGVVMPLRSE